VNRGVRRVQQKTFLYILSGALLLLVISGAGAGVISFLLLRAGYDILVWGLLPFLSLLLISLTLCGVVWWTAGGVLPGAGRGRDSSHKGSRSGGSRRKDDV
jgi:hypothetical protein